MSDTKMYPIPPNFNMQEFVSNMMQVYQSKGFVVTPTAIGNGVSIDIRKDDDGFKKYVGLGIGIRCNLSLSNGSLLADFTDASWDGKIVAFVIGWFLCLIPLVTAIIGTIQQLDLPKSIANDIQMQLGAAPMGGVPFQPPYPQQANQPQYQQPQTACTQCGAIVNADAQFCPTCGVKRT